MKIFIRDEYNKITNCDSNRAKMNVFEFIWYIDKASYPSEVIHSLLEGAKGLGLFLSSVIGLALTPILIFVRAKIAIDRSKKEVLFWRKEGC